jgi:hypothetical protein
VGYTNGFLSIEDDRRGNPALMPQIELQLDALKVGHLGGIQNRIESFGQIWGPGA